jgi:hypothetical protein
VPTTIVSTNNRMRHFGFAPLTRPMLLAGADRHNELGDHCSADRVAQSTRRCPSPPPEAPRKPQACVSSPTGETTANKTPPIRQPPATLARGICGRSGLIDEGDLSLAAVGQPLVLPTQGA